MMLNVKFLVALSVLFLSTVGTAVFAQQEGPFDESEPPFAPSFKKANSAPEVPPKIDSRRKNSKSRKSDDSFDSLVSEREHNAEKQLFLLVNNDRAKLNQPPLQYSPRLSAMAKAHAKDMMNKNFFSHTNKEGLDAQARAAKMNIGAGVYENIAYQQGDIEDLQKVINLENDFMSEPDGPKNHRYNILFPNHTSLGVGVAIKGDKLILVEEFTDSPPTGEN